ncbi:MAG: DNA-binding transcriptional regulator Fis [Gammaproteobacteria bacterium]|nr:DNA-binding transcriptional regulator Fis [Gammaproteobacteria bacterium]MDE2346410.1 DNA-binding transcriptional regulator Fis [Gammaproteobacteria bacterium]
MNSRPGTLHTEFTNEAWRPRKGADGAAHAAASHCLREYAEKTLRRYFSDLRGHDPSGLYGLVLGEIEQPLLKTLMDYTRGNQSRASEILGINRSTLRKKLRQYKIST